MIQKQKMSEEQVRIMYKADKSFYLGFANYRSGFRNAIAVHFIEIVMLAVFLPIDCTLLPTGDKMVTALAIATVDSAVSLLLTLYQYAVLFRTTPILSYCLLARDTHHATNEPVTDLSSIEACTSEAVMHAASGAPVAGMTEQFMNIYGSIACGEIEQMNEFRLPQLGWCGKVYNFLALGAMLVVIILLATSSRLNAAEIAILVVFLLLEAFLRLKIIIILALVVLSPLICLLLVCYICCCRQQEGSMKMDLRAKPATTDDILKSGGECAICLMNIRASESIYQLKCSDKHVFHEGCLDNWAKVKPTCPACRAELPMVETHEQLNQNPPQ